jgi:hypothetical protein
MYRTSVNTFIYAIDINASLLGVIGVSEGFNTGIRNRANDKLFLFVGSRYLI